MPNTSCSPTRRPRRRPRRASAQHRLLPPTKTEANEIAAKTNALLKKSKADKVDKAIIEVLEISAAAADEVGAGAWAGAAQPPVSEHIRPNTLFQTDSSARPPPRRSHVVHTPTQVVSAFQDPHAEELKLEKKHAEEKKTKAAVAAAAPPTAAQQAMKKQAKVRRAQPTPLT